MENLPDLPEGFEGELFRLLFESAEIATFTPQERIKLENDMRTERDLKNQIAYAKEEGREEGAREKALESARAFLKLGVPAEAVSAGTGLSLEEVLALS